MKRETTVSASTRLDDIGKSTIRSEYQTTDGNRGAGGATRPGLSAAPAVDGGADRLQSARERAVAADQGAVPEDDDALLATRAPAGELDTSLPGQRVDLPLESVDCPALGLELVFGLQRPWHTSHCAG